MLWALAYKEIKKTGEFVLPGFGKLVNLHTFPKPRVKRIPLIFLMPDHLCLDAREPKWKLSDHNQAPALEIRRLKNGFRAEDSAPLPARA